MTECIDDLLNTINKTVLEIFETDTPNWADESYVSSVCEYIQTTFKHVFPDKLLFNEFITQQVYLLAHTHLGEKGLYDSEYVFQETPSSLARLKTQVKYLETSPQPAQRTPEWYAYREQRLTASDVASVFNKNPFGTYRELLIKKGLPADPNDDKWKSLSTNRFIVHGVKYEPVATWFYEHLKQTCITEFGCLPHEEIPFLGASPDGISPNGVMLEIKCPFSRPIYGIPPIYYWYQMQLQLEVAKLNQCDFLECDIKEKTVGEWDELVKNNNYTTSHDVGAVIEIFDIKADSTNYEYFPYGSDLSDIPAWEEKIIDTILESEHQEYRATHRWFMNKYACTPIYRDRRWFNRSLPELTTFWKKVETVRQTGELPEQFQTSTQKSLSKPDSSNSIPCLILDSDSDDNPTISSVVPPAPKSTSTKVFKFDGSNQNSKSKPKPKSKSKSKSKSVTTCLILDSDSD